MYGPQQPYYQQPRYAAPVAQATPKPAATATVAEVTPATAVTTTYNMQIPGSFMFVFWLLAIGIFALVIAVITKLFFDHKRGKEAAKWRAKFIEQYNS